MLTDYPGNSIIVLKNNVRSLKLSVDLLRKIVWQVSIFSIIIVLIDNIIETYMFKSLSDYQMFGCRLVNYEKISFSYIQTNLYLILNVNILIW